MAGVEAKIITPVLMHVEDNGFDSGFRQTKIGGLYLVRYYSYSREGIVIRKNPDNSGEVCASQSAENCANCIEKAVCPIPALMADGIDIPRE
jgi:hypothetical protein